MGIFSEMVRRIRSLQEQGAVVIDKRDITQGFDLTEMSVEEKDKRLLAALGSCALNACEYRSLTYGKGVYVRVDALDNPFVLKRLCEHAGANVEKRQVIAEGLQKRYSDSLDRHPEYQQLYFDEKGDVLPEPTDEELIEMLMAEGQ